MGKGPFSFRRTMISRRRTKKTVEMPLLPAPSLAMTGSATLSPLINETSNSLSAMVVASKSKKKAGGVRLWMRFDRFGQSELTECDKSTIIERVSIPARDLRIHGPVFSDSSNILAREKATVVNLEFVKAIVTAEEILLLDPLRQEVISFVDQLRQQLLILHTELPFELQVLEIALEVVCTYLDSKVADLEREAYPALDELIRNVSIKNLENVRGLKSNLTRLLARVQKMRDEIEHLLDDHEDMAHLYLTRKQHHESGAMAASNNSITAHLGNKRSGSLVTTTTSNDVEDLEMMLEAYFIQLDGTRNKILSVREYIDDTEDYLNIQLDNKRNGLIQLQLTLRMASFAICVENLVDGLFGMNIHCKLYDKEGIFGLFVGTVTAGCVLIFLLLFGYARWKNLLGS